MFADSSQFERARTILTACALTISAGISGPVHAQENFTTDPFDVVAGSGLSIPPGTEVVATLVSENNAIAPGETFTVALKMVHSGPWHTYWENPGTGVGTTLEWSLPDGFSAGPILWPVPESKEDVIGTSNIFGGTAYLLTDITSSDDVTAGSTVNVAVKAKWLQCDETCTPKTVDVNLRLPVVADPSAVTSDPGIKSEFDKVRAQQPTQSALVDIAIEDKGAEVSIQITPSSDANPAPGNVYIYHLAKKSLSNPSVQATKSGDSYTATFEKLDTSEEVSEIDGFAFAENGWGDDIYSVALQKEDTTSVAPTNDTSSNAASSGGIATITELTPNEKAALREVLSWGKAPLGKEEKPGHCP